MKNIKFLIAAICIMFVTVGSAQTPFPSGIRFPDINQVTTADSIPVMGSNGVIKSWIPADSLRGTMPTGLEAINESKGIGWRLKGRNPANYGNIGLDAIDFSVSTSSSSSMGSTGLLSFSTGENNIASGIGAVVFGQDSENSGYISLLTGGSNINTTYATLINGYGNEDSGGLGRGYNFMTGRGNKIHGGFGQNLIGTGLIREADSAVGTVVLGAGNLDVNTSAGGMNALTPMIIVGNGTHTTSPGGDWSNATRSNLLVGLRNGEVTLPSTTIPVIDNEITGKQVPTKEWVLSKIPSTTGNLQQVTDIGYVTTNPIESGSYLQSGLETTIPNKKKYLDVLRISTGEKLITYQTEYWDIISSSFEPTSNVFIGKNAGLNSYNISNNAFGENALSNNTAGQSNGFGTNALSYNKGSESNGFGYFALSSNSGNSSNGFGSLALYNNRGNNSNGFGSNSLAYNRGNNSNGFGNYSLYQNLGNNVNGTGHQVLQYNDRNNNTALGHNAFGGFYDDVTNKKDALPQDVSIGTKLITITNHGFNPNNGYINLRYTTTGTPISYLSNNQIYQFQVIDNNTIATSYNNTSQGTGIHTFTPQYQYTNSTTIGANSHPSDSNQITLGDPNVTEIDTYGRHRSRAYGQGHVTGTPTYNLAVDSAGRFIETAMGGGQKDYKIISTATYTLLPSDNNKVLLFTYYENNGGWISGEVSLTIDNNLPSNFDCEVHSANGSDILVNDIDDPLVDFGPRPAASILLYLNGASKGQGRIIKLTGNRVYTTGFEWVTGG